MRYDELERTERKTTTTMPPPAKSGQSRSEIGVWLGPVTFLAMLSMSPPDGLSPVAWRVAAVGALMAVWWVTEAVPIPATALVPLVLFPVLGVSAIGTAAAPYANPVIFLFMGGFMIAAALERCGLHQRLALSIVGRVGTQPSRLVAGFMAATAFLSMWVSNTATVVMMLPTALSVVLLAEERIGSEIAQDLPGTGRPEPVASHFALTLMLGIAYAANIGGLGTLIGTPPNALLAGFLADTYGITIGFGAWMLLGVPLVVVALPLCWWLLTRVLYPIRLQELPGGREKILAEVAALGKPSRAEVTVGAITALTAAAWISRPAFEEAVPGLSDAGIAIAGALLLFLVPVSRDGRSALGWEQAENMPWGVLVLFGGGLSLAHAIQDTGLAEWLGATMSGMNAWPLWLVALVVTTVVVFLTELTSNTATAAAFLPVVGSLAVGIGADPRFLAVPTALAASCAFMMPVATPPNAIVYGSGKITIPQMVRAGLVLNVVMIALILAAVFLLAGPLLG